MSAVIYRPEIDGLRGLAVGAVLANHFFGEFFPNGYLGVDVFFVISGFVITASLQNRSDQGLGQFLVSFYVRRVKRLFPALAVCIGFTSVLISFVNPSSAQHLMTGLWALFGLGNIYLWRQANDYFGDAASLNPFTHTWSLGVEEQFYFVFPLLFWIGMKLLPRRIALWGLIGGVFASVLAWGVTQGHDPVAAFYIVLFRFWEIGMGVLAWSLQGRWKPADGLAMACKWITVLIVTSVLVMPVYLTLTVTTLAVVLSAAAFLMLTRPSYRPITPLNWGPARYIGRISYSLYLWHWPVAVLLKWTLGLSMVTASAGVLASVVLAHLSYSYLERPLRHARWAGGPGRELIIGLSAMVVIAGLLAINGKYLRDFMYLGTEPALIAQGVSSLTDPYRSRSGVLWNGGACVLSSNSEVGKQIDPSECTVGAPLDQAGRRVLVIGNSFSAALVAAFDLEPVVDEPETAFVLTSSWGAPIVPEIPSRGAWALANDHYLSSVFPALVADLSTGDHVLIASDLAGLSPRVRQSQIEATYNQLEIGLRRLSLELSARGIGLAIIGPLPFAREAGCEPSLAQPQWYAPNGGPCRYYTRAETLRRMAPLHELLTRLADDGVLSVVDAFDIFCPGDVCRYFDPKGVILYRDVFSHPSVEAAQLMRPYVRDWLQTADPAAASNLQSKLTR